MVYFNCGIGGRNVQLCPTKERGVDVLLVSWNHLDSEGNCTVVSHYGESEFR